MTKTILFLFVFYLSSIGNAQTNKEIDIDKLTSDFIKNLQSRKIDTICVYENYCVGSVKIYDASQFENNIFCAEDFPNDPVYIFWIEKGRKYFTKISICAEYVESLNDDNIFWHMYFPNNDIIEKEEIKPFQYKTSSKEIYTIIIDHSCHQNLKFLIGNQIIEKRFDFFNLKKEENVKVNINYNHNIHLISKELIDILKKTTSEAEKNNIFKKIKSR
ncbi:hypothetical protein [Flavobacterium aquidurense]|uniref:Uncharacterized protein n=1 Tax=Flavobacterium aquidurense TaxID=362413 RepID=A0A0Q0XSN0_9FLAO|nr:hypothetical protein [Flavobacterium aquidurense]KQB39185.1 hypothetical protein RC62_863 [Flavobacterium aquidurense]